MVFLKIWVEFVLIVFFTALHVILRLNVVEKGRPSKQRRKTQQQFLFPPIVSLSFFLVPPPLIAHGSGKKPETTMKLFFSPHLKSKYVASACHTCFGFPNFAAGDREKKSRLFYFFGDGSHHRPWPGVERGNLSRLAGFFLLKIYVGKGGEDCFEIFPLRIFPIFRLLPLLSSNYRPSAKRLPSRAVRNSLTTSFSFLLSPDVFVSTVQRLPTSRCTNWHKYFKIQIKNTLFSFKFMIFLFLPP